jgi:hypothetical protein
VATQQLTHVLLSLVRGALATRRSAGAKNGFAVHVYTATASMEDSCLANADGDMLIVPQQGARRTGPAPAARVAGGPFSWLTRGCFSRKKDSAEPRAPVYFLPPAPPQAPPPWAWMCRRAAAADGVWCAGGGAAGGGGGAARHPVLSGATGRPRQVGGQRQGGPEDGGRCQAASRRQPLMPNGRQIAAWLQWRGQLHLK